MRREQAAEIEACLHMMCRSTRVALANLQRHAADIKEAVASLDQVASTDMADMEELLGRYHCDLAVLAHIPVCNKLLGKRTLRMLGDFISEPKMHAVAEICRRELSEMQERHAHAQQTEAGLCRDMGELAAEIGGLSFQPSIDTAADITRIAQQVTHIDDVDRLAELDSESHEALEQLVSDRNEMVGLHLNLVQDVSSVQSDFAELTRTLEEIDADLATKLDGFKHLARLKGMLGAYATSLVEGVRRREFTHAFISQAQSLAELMARLGTDEQARRKEYTADVGPQLPWDIVGLEGAVPALEISTRRDTYGAAFSRKDVEDLLNTLVVLEDHLHANGTLRRANPVAEARALVAMLLPPPEACADNFAAAVRRELMHESLSGASDVSDADPAPSDRAAHDQLERERALHLDTQAKLARVTSERDAAQAREERTRDDAAATERALRSERDEARKAHADIAARLESMLAQGATAEVQIKALHEQVGSTKRELQDTHALAGQHYDSRGAASRRRMEAELRERTVQMARLHSEVGAARSATDVLQGQLLSADAQQSEMAAQLETARASAAHAEAERERAERECAAVAASAAELVRVATALRLHVHGMRQSHGAGATVHGVLSSLQSGDAVGAERALKEFDANAFHNELQTQLDMLASASEKWEKAYRSASGKYAKSTAAARERISFRNFESGQLALFTTCGGKWLAFSTNMPHHYLRVTDELRAHLQSREWLLARILRIDTVVAAPENEYGIHPGTTYAVVDVDGWQDVDSMLRASKSHRLRSVSDPFVAAVTPSTDDTLASGLHPSPANVTSHVLCTDQASARFSLRRSSK